ncbi:TfpX/TfpZ family type IV pilin accessory protein [Rhizobacter sp. Root1221]|uniref:TfpX/TfpZ family type IV pilin accessory protein n=1 Tax=Rhizobacter sp. Root1221 TaxID=1736433 RepID=UPI0006FB8342|nr:TfpX/TfpZ family type IV pilin accessory protein [Rhizobacter sp. Root1221]KQV96997.1 hypothetical protein ASC87_24310 [Rhizobacter sp. Root1221]
MLASLHLKQRTRAGAIHLAISFAVAALAAGLVFGLWYPGAFRSLAGGRELFFLVVSVDVVMGPVLTFAVFDLTRKTWPHLRRDLITIGVLQMAALGYGLHTVYAVRPVALVFEVDRLRVISAADVQLSELPVARPEYQRLPLTGPWQLAAREPAAGAENTESLFMGLKGVDLGQRPSFWQPYDEALPRILARTRPIQQLLARFPARQPELMAALADAGLDASTARFIPVSARGEWVALLDATGHVAGFAPFDGFF